VFIRSELEAEDDSQVVVRISVRDSGIGIPADRIGSIFDPFTQADGSTTRKYGGTGLGLAICKQLTELMGGSIDVESKEDSGSTFWFTVVLKKPAAVGMQGQIFACAEAPDMVTPAGATPQQYDIVGKNILIVDDNDTSRFLLITLLSAWGCHYATAPDGETALALLHESVADGAPFDAAIIDFQMPGMDGLELGRKLRDNHAFKTVRMIMLSSQGLRGDRELIERTGFSGYLTKPTRQDTLKECLALVLSREAGKGMADSPVVTHHIIAEVSGIRKRVLLAEDNTVNQMVAVALLKKIGVTVDVVADGNEAVKALEQINYDLVLMDCQMPVMDGYEATRVIRDASSAVLNHAVPVVAMTANAMQGDREKCLAAGMNEYTSKPIKLEELKSVLERLLAQSADAAQDDLSGIAGEPYSREDLLARFEGDEAFINEIIAMGRESLPVRLANLKLLISQRGFSAARLEAHTIKGIAANFSAEPLRAAALALEKELVNPAPARIDALSETLETCIVELLAALPAGNS
jgi:CheY-like chemotaxis protein